MGAHPAAPESPISKSADYPKLLSPTGFNAGRFVPQTGDALRVLIEEETPSQVDGFRLGGSGTPARGAVRFRARSGGLAGARPPATFWQPFRLRQGYGGPAGLRNWLPGNHFQQEFLKSGMRDSSLGSLRYLGSGWWKPGVAGCARQPTRPRF